jgi:hypothetical protein
LCAFLGHQGGVRRACRAVRSAVHAGRRRRHIPGIEVRDFLLQSEPGRSPVPKPRHPEAVARFWQEIVGNSDPRIDGDGVAAPDAVDRVRAIASPSLALSDQRRHGNRNTSSELRRARDEFCEVKGRGRHREQNGSEARALFPLGKSLDGLLRCHSPSKDGRLSTPYGSSQ